MPSPPVSLTTLVAELAATGVEFILVGGLAAVAQGAPITTHDVDIVPHRAPENIDSLLRFLRAHDAHYRSRPDRLEPTHAALLGPGHHLLSTNLGPLKRQSQHPKDKLVLAILEAMLAGDDA